MMIVFYMFIEVSSTKTDCSVGSSGSDGGSLLTDKIGPEIKFPTPFLKMKFSIES